MNYFQIRTFRERLAQVDGLKVKSVGGSSVEGPYIILLVEQPVPLRERLSQLDLIERVSKRKEWVEVSIRPERELSA